MLGPESRPPRPREALRVAIDTRLHSRRSRGGPSGRVRPRVRLGAGRTADFADRNGFVRARNGPCEARAQRPANGRRSRPDGRTTFPGVGSLPALDRASQTGAEAARRRFGPTSPDAGTARAHCATSTARAQRLPSPEDPEDRIPQSHRGNLET